MNEPCKHCDKLIRAVVEADGVKRWKHTDGTYQCAGTFAEPISQ